MKSHFVFEYALRTCLMLSIVCITSCLSTKPPLSEYQQESLRQQKEAERLTAISNKYRAQYAAKYAAYRCEKPGLPVVSSHKFPLNDNHSIDVSKLRPIELVPGIAVRTRLGEVIRLKGRGGPLRTGTRHIVEVAGKEVGRAAGLLTLYGDSEASGSSSIIFSTDTREILIEDFIGGAGARYRHMAFMPDLGSTQTKDALPIKWRMVYVDLPSQTDIGSDCGILGKIHGLLNGKIYVEMDNQFYAFPVDDFVEETLEFSMG